MALTEQIIQTYSIQSALGTVAAEVFVDADGALCAAGEMPFGVNYGAVVAGNEQLITTFGLVRVVAGAAITADVQVEVGAAGKAITLAAGIAAGYAVTDAAGAGSIVLVRIPT